MQTPYAQQVVDFLKRLSSTTTAKQLRQIIDSAKGKEIYGICECILNILYITVGGISNVIPGWLVDKLKKFKRQLRQLGQGKRKVTLERRRELLRLPSCLKWLPDLLCFLIPILESDHVHIQTPQVDA